ncbi:MAG: hypothetical protein QW660_06890 [Candidatus Bathyarchaeia archaeon]
MWLNEVRGCSSTYKRLRLPIYGSKYIEIDVAGAKIIRGEKKFYAFDKIVVFLVGIETKLAYIERQKLLGQLLEYSKSVNDLGIYFLSEYGRCLVGPDELFVYACVPEALHAEIQAILRDTGIGLLLFSSLKHDEEILLNEIVKPFNLSKCGMSAKVRQNLRIFDTLCKEHPLYSKLFPEGRKHIF